MLFQKALRRLTPDQRRAFRAWQTRARARRGAGGPPEDGRKVVTNLSAEDPLGRDGDPEEEVFRRFLVRLSLTRTRANLKKSYEKACASFTLEGPEVSGRTSGLVSRVIPADVFLRELGIAAGRPAAASSLNKPAVEVERFLTRWRRRRARVLRDLEKVRLGRRDKKAVFLVFDISDADRSDPATLNRRIGKDPPPDPDTILLEMEIPVAALGPKRYPTVCDAGWSGYFKPSAREADFGRTLDLNQRPPGPGLPEIVAENSNANCVRDFRRIPSGTP